MFLFFPNQIAHIIIVIILWICGKRTSTTDLQINPQLDSLDRCIIQTSNSHFVSTVKKNLFVINRNSPTTRENKIQAATLQCTCSQNCLCFLKNPKFPCCLYEQHPHLLDWSIYNEVRSAIYNVSWRTRGDISFRLMAFCSLCGKVIGDLRSQWVSFHRGPLFQQKYKQTETPGHRLYNLTAK